MPYATGNCAYCVHAAKVEFFFQFSNFYDLLQKKKNPDLTIFLVVFFFNLHVLRKKNYTILPQKKVHYILHIFEFSVPR